MHVSIRKKHVCSNTNNFLFHDFLTQHPERGSLQWKWRIPHTLRHHYATLEGLHNSITCRNDERPPSARWVVELAPGLPGIARLNLSICNFQMINLSWNQPWNGDISISTFQSQVTNSCWLTEISEGQGMEDQNPNKVIDWHLYAVTITEMVLCPGNSYPRGNRATPGYFRTIWQIKWFLKDVFKVSWDHKRGAPLGCL